MTSAFSGVVIAGAGQSAYSKKTDQPLQGLLHDACSRALENAGLGWSEVDGFALTSFQLPPDNVTTVAEHFGLQPKFLFQGLYGGASGVIGMTNAARALRDGACDVALVAAVDSFDVASHNDTLDHFNGSVREFMSPQGFGGANGMFALHTRLYMERHGTTREDFGQFCIALRDNASRNPNALLRKPMSMDDYLNAKPIADPLRLFDCVMPCCGADAIVLVSERIARQSQGPAVRIAAAEEIHNYLPNDMYRLPGGFEGMRERLYQRAGCSPGDLDFAQLYDDYPVMAFIQLEGLGLCPSGGSARFIREQGLTTWGRFPINTGGGQLSAGQAGASGGMIGVYEAATQLLGQAGERQVKATRGLVCGYGMVAYGRGLSSSAAILERVS